VTLFIGRGVILYRRSEWGARAPRYTTRLNASFGTTSHWEGPHMGFPWAHSACFSLVRGIQNFHMDARGWSDIAYTALTCPHGYAFEGRWIGHRTAANGTNDGNNRAGAVCYLGGQGDPFTADGQRAQRAVLDYLDANGSGPGRNGHRDWKPTECPGDTIYRWVHSGQAAPGGPIPPDEPIPEEEPDMRQLIWTSEENPGPMVITDGIHGRRIGQTEADYFVFVGVAAPGPNGGGEPWKVPQARIARLELVGGSAS
jgi:hypothetical protein